jgi:DUF1009 family protein
MSRRKPTRREWDDIRLGIRIARASGALDVGQTAITRKHAVVAVEAMEGTDACIKRAGSLAEGTVIVKMAKPAQDVRFDVPCVGPETLRTMIDAEAAVLAVEAGRSFLLDRERTLTLADQNGIAVVGITADDETNGAPGDAANDAP